MSAHIYTYFNEYIVHASCPDAYIYIPERIYFPRQLSRRIYIHTWTNIFIITCTRQLSGGILLHLNIVEGSEYIVFSIEMPITQTWSKSSLFEHRHWLYIERILDFGKNHIRTLSKRNAMAPAQLDIVEGLKHMVFSIEKQMTNTWNNISLFAHRYSFTGGFHCNHSGACVCSSGNLALHTCCYLHGVLQF